MKAGLNRHQANRIKVLPAIKKIRRIVGRQLHDIRVKQKLTLAQLARRSGLSVKLIDLMEIGRGHFNILTLAILAEALKHPLPHFLKTRD